MSPYNGHCLVVLQFEILDVHCLPEPGLSGREMTAAVTRTAVDSPGMQQILSQGYPLLPVVTALKGDSLRAIMRGQGHVGCSLLELEGSRWPRPEASLALGMCHQVCGELWGKGLGKMYFWASAEESRVSPPARALLAQLLLQTTWQPTWDLPKGRGCS